MNEISRLEGLQKLKTIGRGIFTLQFYQLIRIDNLIYYLGAFGTATLYKRLSDNQHIVLKEIFIQDMDEDEIKQSMNEVKILSSLTHPNIIKYTNYKIFELILVT